jgi:hypothetical protein
MENPMETPMKNLARNTMAGGIDHMQLPLMNTLS